MVRKFWTINLVEGLYKLIITLRYAEKPTYSIGHYNYALFHESDIVTAGFSTGGPIEIDEFKETAEDILRRGIDSYENTLKWESTEEG